MCVCEEERGEEGEEEEVLDECQTIAPHKPELDLASA